MIRFALGLGLLSLTAACGGDSNASAATLRFTAIPDSNTTELVEKFQPVADYLAGELGVEVEYVPVTSYEASVEAFRNGEVHLAWFGGVTGVQARAAVEGARAIAQGKVDPEYADRPLHTDGRLADIAPTALQLLGVEIPPEMTGKGLISTD